MSIDPRKAKASVNPREVAELSAKIADLLKSVAVRPMTRLAYGDIWPSAQTLARHFLAHEAAGYEADLRKPAPNGRPRKDEDENAGWYHPSDRKRLEAFRAALVAGEPRLQRPRLNLRMDAHLRNLARARGLSPLLRGPGEPGGISRDDWLDILDAVLAPGAGRPVEYARRENAALVRETYDALVLPPANLQHDPEGRPSGAFADFVTRLDMLLPPGVRLLRGSTWASFRTQQPAKSRRHPKTP